MPETITKDPLQILRAISKMKASERDPLKKAIQTLEQLSKIRFKIARPPENFKLSIEGVELPPSKVKLTKQVIEFPNPTKNQIALKEHQIDGAERCLSSFLVRDGFLLCDAPGLGKTATALSVVKHLEIEKEAHNLAVRTGGVPIIKTTAQPVSRKYLIIIPNTGKDNLISQWREQGEIMGLDVQGLAQVSFQTMREEKNGIYICGYDDIVRGMMFNSPERYYMIIFDECHKMKNYATSKTCYYGYQLQLLADKVLYMSATPYQSLSDMHYLSRLGIFDTNPYKFEPSPQKWVSFKNQQDVLDRIEAGEISYLDTQMIIKFINDDRLKVPDNELIEFTKAKSPYKKFDDNIKWIESAVKEKLKNDPTWQALPDQNILTIQELQDLLRPDRIKLSEGFEEFMVENGAKKDIVTDIKGGQTETKISESISQEFLIAMHIRLTMLGQMIKRYPDLSGLDSQFYQAEMLTGNTPMPPAEVDYYRATEMFYKMAEQVKYLANWLLKNMGSMKQFWVRAYSEYYKSAIGIDLALRDHEAGRHPIIFAQYNVGGHNFLWAGLKVVVAAGLVGGLWGGVEFETAINYINARKDGTARSAITKHPQDPNLYSLIDWFEGEYEQLSDVPPITESIAERIAEFMNKKTNQNKPVDFWVARIYGAESANLKSIEEKEAFKTGKKKFAVSSISKGGTGLSFHDELGGMPRTQINLTLPFDSFSFAQLAGRTHRLGSLTATKMWWLYSNTAEELKYAKRTYQRLRLLNSSVSGYAFSDDSTSKMVYALELDDEEIEEEMNLDPVLVHKHYVSFYTDPMKFRADFFADEVNRNKALKEKKVNYQYDYNNKLVHVSLYHTLSDNNEAREMREIEDIIFTISESQKKLADSLMNKLSTASGKESWYQEEVESLIAINHCIQNNFFDQQNNRYIFFSSSPEHPYLNDFLMQVVIGQYDPNEPFKRPPRMIETRAKGEPQDLRLGAVDDRDFEAKKKEFLAIFRGAKNHDELHPVLIAIENNVQFFLHRLSEKITNNPYFGVKPSKNHFIVPGRGNRYAGEIDILNLRALPRFKSDTSLLLKVFQIIYDQVSAWWSANSIWRQENPGKTPSESDIMKKWRKIVGEFEKKQQEEKKEITLVKEIELDLSSLERADETEIGNKIEDALLLSSDANDLLRHLTRNVTESTIVDLQKTKNKVKITYQPKDQTGERVVIYDIKKKSLERPKVKITKELKEILGETESEMDDATTSKANLMSVRDLDLVQGTKFMEQNKFMKDVGQLMRRFLHTIMPVPDDF